ncbi:hypothetical protein [Mycoplasmopsis agalactiae]|uniref:hypothetical protein n=1 Tax=Mycoplasmopsis agalactiae TaxID=2110 RepID=UPI001F1A8F7B|nr:hypothetical protein [Mycoplasmopsis agalactiae]
MKLNLLSLTLIKTTFYDHSAQEFEADYINPLILPNEKDELLEDDEYDESDIGSSIWTRLINENLDTSVQTVNAQSNIFARHPKST